MAAPYVGPLGEFSGGFGASDEEAHLVLIINILYGSLGPHGISQKQLTECRKIAARKSPSETAEAFHRYFCVDEK